MISCADTYDAATPSCVAYHYKVYQTLNVHINTIIISHLCNRDTEGFYLSFAVILLLLHG
jgi:hypothetical protein